MERRDVRYQAAVVLDDHVLLLKIFDRADGVEFWLLPGGGREPGEGEAECLRRELRVVGGHGNLLALILQHWFPSVDHAFWSRLTMPDIYTLTLHDEGPPELARRWDAESRFVPKPRGSEDA